MAKYKVALWIECYICGNGYETYDSFQATCLSKKCKRRHSRNNQIESKDNNIPWVKKECRRPDKIKYATSGEAYKERDKINRDLNVYQCTCGYYHLGRSTVLSFP